MDTLLGVEPQAVTRLGVEGSMELVEVAGDDATVSPPAPTPHEVSMCPAASRIGAMQCPVDQTILQMTERQSVEIDYCPQCRGVWLDRGELDKIIDRSPDAPAPPPREEQARHEQPRRHDDDRAHDSPRVSDPGYVDRNHHDRQDDSTPHKKRRKESFLGDLFDF